jgi:hypothetical protein
MLKKYTLYKAIFGMVSHMVFLTKLDLSPKSVSITFLLSFPPPHLFHTFGGLTANEKREIIIILILMFFKVPTQPCRSYHPFF